MVDQPNQPALFHVAGLKTKIADGFTCHGVQKLKISVSSKSPLLAGQ
jgi:hypothetical protein